MNRKKNAQVLEGPFLAALSSREDGVTKDLILLGGNMGLPKRVCPNVLIETWG